VPGISMFGDVLKNMLRDDILPQDILQALTYSSTSGNE